MPTSPAEIGLVRDPVRPLSTTYVAMAYPGELAIDPTTGNFVYKKLDGSTIEHRKPGTLTLRYGTSVLAENKDLAGSLDITIPAATTPGNLTIKYGANTLIDAKSMGDDIVVNIPESEIPEIDTSSLVPNTRTVNGKALSSDISLTAADVGAVPTTRTINGKALSSDISITAAELGAAPLNYPHNIGAVVSNLQLSTSWTGSAAPYTQDLAVSGLLATDVPTVDFRATGTYSTDQKAEEAWLNIYRIVSSANKLTFYAHAKPTVAIPITIKYT